MRIIKQNLKKKGLTGVTINGEGDGAVSNADAQQK